MRVLLIILLLSVTAVASKAMAQKVAGWTEAKATRLSKKHLVYLWIGNASPGSHKTKYGFDIQSIGCNSFPRYTWHNRIVVAKINLVYGWRWFEKNRIEIAYDRD